jgi:hypothetical protein
MAYIAAGRTFQMWVSVDAFLVLGGSVRHRNRCPVGASQHFDESPQCLLPVPL